MFLLLGCLIIRGSSRRVKWVIGCDFGWLRDVVGGITTLRLMMMLLCDFIFECFFCEIS